MKFMLLKKLAVLFCLSFALMCQGQQANRTHIKVQPSPMALQKGWPNSGNSKNLEEVPALFTVSVKHQWLSLTSEADMVFANSQTINGGDPFHIRFRNNREQLKVQEEKSKDAETNHVFEDVSVIQFTNQPDVLSFFTGTISQKFRQT